MLTTTAFEPAIALPPSGPILPDAADCLVFNVPDRRHPVARRHLTIRQLDGGESSTTHLSLVGRMHGSYYAHRSWVTEVRTIARSCAMLLAIGSLRSFKLINRCTAEIAFSLSLGLRYQVNGKRD